MRSTDAVGRSWFRSVRLRLACFYAASVAVVSALVLSCLYLTELHDASHHACEAFVLGGQELNFADYHVGQVRNVLLFAWVSLVVGAGCVGFFCAPFITRAAEEAMEVLSRSADAIAHDLRAPLTRLKVRAELAAVQEGPLGEFAAEIAGDTQGMLTLVNTLLDLSRLERSGAVPAESVDLADVLHAVGDLFEPSAEVAGVAFTLETGTTPAQVKGSRGRLMQAVGNLVDNAIKYTPAGGSVRVALAPHRDGFAVTVQDDGIGIPEESQAHVFEKFYRGANATAPGDGLGLALVQAIVSAAGGRLTLVSSPGHGSTFTLVLPRA